MERWMRDETVLVGIRFTRLIWLIVAICLFIGITQYHFHIKESRYQEEKFLAQARYTREMLYKLEIEAVKQKLEDPNISVEVREKLSSAYVNIVDTMSKEVQIELLLKGLGYDKVLCYIEGDTAKIMMKSLNSMESDEQTLIENMIKGTFSIKRVQILESDFRGSFYGHNKKLIYVIDQDILSWSITFLYPGTLFTMYAILQVYYFTIMLFIMIYCNFLYMIYNF
jgi:hypothetical protein